MADNQDLPVLILGVSPAGRTAASILILRERFIYGYLSLDPNETRAELDDLPILGALSNPELRGVLEGKKAEYFVAAPLAAQRESLMREMIALTQLLPLNVVHPAATMDATADLAAGNLIGAGAVIGAGVRMEAVNVLGMGVLVEAEVVIGAGCAFGAGAVVGAGARLGSRLHVGAGAVIQAGVQIGDEAVIAPGAVVLRDVAAGEQVVGNPAQSVR